MSATTQCPDSNITLIASPFGYRLPLIPPSTSSTNHQTLISSDNLFFTAPTQEKRNQRSKKKRQEILNINSFKEPWCLFVFTLLGNGKWKYAFWLKSECLQRQQFYRLTKTAMTKYLFLTPHSLKHLIQVFNAMHCFSQKMSLNAVQPSVT